MGHGEGKLKPGPAGFRAPEIEAGIVKLLGAVIPSRDRQEAFSAVIPSRDRQGALFAGRTLER